MTRIAALIVSTYVSMVLFTTLPFIQKLIVVEGASQLFWNHLAIFLILLVITSFLISKHISPSYSRRGMRPARVFLYTVAFIGLLLSVLYHVIPLDPVYNLPPLLDTIFASDLAHTLWLIIPLLVLIV